jgi:hypothetical protein
MRDLSATLDRWIGSYVGIKTKLDAIFQFKVVPPTVLLMLGMLCLHCLRSRTGRRHAHCGPILREDVPAAAATSSWWNLSPLSRGEREAHNDAGCCGRRPLPAEAHAARRRPVVAGEEAVVHSAVGRRVHRADVGVPLRRELPVEQKGGRVLRTGALKGRGR